MHSVLLILQWVHALTNPCLQYHIICLYEIYESHCLSILSCVYAAYSVKFIPCGQLLLILYLGSGHHGSVCFCPSSSSYTERLDNHSERSKPSNEISFTACPTINPTTWYIVIHTTFRFNICMHITVQVHCNVNHSPTSPLLSSLDIKILHMMYELPLD